MKNGTEDASVYPKNVNTHNNKCTGQKFVLRIDDCRAIFTHSHIELVSPVRFWSSFLVKALPNLEQRCSKVSTISNNCRTVLGPRLFHSDLAFITAASSGPFRPWTIRVTYRVREIGGGQVEGGQVVPAGGEFGISRRSSRALGTWP